MERPTFYNLIEPGFNPGDSLLWNKQVLAHLAKTGRLANHILITEMEYAYFHPDRERIGIALSPSGRETSQAMLKQVFPDCPPSLSLPAVVSYFDPVTGLSTITLNHEAIQKRAGIADPDNPDKEYIRLINSLTRRCLWRIMQAEKLQAVGDILSIPLGELETLAVNLVYNAASLLLIYGGYQLSKWTVGNPDLSLGWRIGLAIPVGSIDLGAISLEALVLIATASSAKTCYQTFKDYFCYAGAGAELLDNLAASWVVTKELCFNRPCLVSWK